MIRFIIRRLIAMVGVLFAVSVLIFTIFNVIPNGDPAQRMAGKNPTPEQMQAFEKRENARLDRMTLDRWTP